MSDDRFRAVTDFEGLRWHLPVIVVGDGPDARVCRFLFRSGIRHCHPSQGFIEFMNGCIFYTEKRCLADGTPVFLFYTHNIAEILKRRMLEYTVEEGLNTAPLDQARTVGEWLLELAGSPRSLSWVPQGCVWSQVESHLLNVGLPDLQLIADLIGYRNPAGAEPPSALALAG